MNGTDEWVCKHFYFRSNKNKKKNQLIAAKYLLCTKEVELWIAILTLCV